MVKLVQLVMRFWNLVRYLLNLLLPVFGKVKGFRGLGTMGRWILRLILIAVIWAGLWWLNDHKFGPFHDKKGKTYEFQFNEFITKKLGNSPPEKFIKSNFLPIFFFSLLGIGWLGVIIWRLLTTKEISEFPDLDEAWQKILDTLEEASIDITEEPLILVLGQTAGGDAALFQAAFSHTQRPLLVNGAPGPGPSPVRAFVVETVPRPPKNLPQRAIFVTCPDASVLAEFSSFLAEEPEESQPAPSEMDTGSIGGMNLFATMRPGAMAPAIQNILRSITQEKRELSEAEREELRRLMGRDEQDLARRIRQSRTPFGEARREKIELQKQRLRHLCRLIAQSRRPWCPANGYLVLIPWFSSDNQKDAEQAAMACREDLQTARETMGVNCPVLAMVTDLEKAEGAREFIRRVKVKNRTRRVGRSFPFTPNLPPAKLEEMVKNGVEWFCTAMLPHWIYQLFDLETAAKPERTPVTDGNIELQQVLTQVLERQDRLSNILSQGFLEFGGEPPLFGGCYLAGTGKSADEQSFVAGVIYRFIDDQDKISWTQKALDEDAWYHRWTSFAWLAVLLLIVGLGGVAYLLVQPIFK